MSQATFKATKPQVRKSLVDTCAIFWLVCISGNPVLYVDYPEAMLVISAVVYLVMMIHRRVPLMDARLISIFVLFGGIFAIQSISSSDIQTVTMAGVVVRMYIGYSVARFTKSFPDGYIDVMYALGIVSMGFYCFDQIFDIKGHLAFLMPYPAKLSHIVVHNFNINYGEWKISDASDRNSSIFWEPGAFAGYLLLAILFLGLNGCRFNPKQLAYRYVVFSLCLASTFSTTGYLLYPLIMIFNFRKRLLMARKISLGTLIFSVVIFPLILAAFNSMSFLNDKISKEFEQSIMEDDNYYLTRMGGIVFDIKDISQKPLFGWGPNPRGRSLDEEQLKGQGNGFTGFIVKFGFVGILIYMYYLYTSFKPFVECSPQASAFIVIFVLAMLNTEYYLNYPLFFSIIFLSRQKLQSLKNS